MMIVYNFKRLPNLFHTHTPILASTMAAYSAGPILKRSKYLISKLSTISSDFKTVKAEF
jgi:hypothetical protein